MDERDVGAGPAVAERHLERVEDQCGAHVGRQLPAHHLAAVGVEHEAEEHQPLPAAQVGQVGDPQLVRPADREVALHQVGPAVGQRVRSGGPPRLASALGALDSVAAHQPLHPAARHPLALPEQRLPGAPIAVGLVVRGVDLADAAEQPLVLECPGRALALRPLVVGRRRHAQGPADRLDPEALAALVDERAHFGRSGSSSRAKNSDADFKISFARRSS